MKPWLSSVVWEQVAAELRDLRRQGLSRFLTEETVRFATVKALVAAGASADALRYEWPHPALKGSRIDLVVGTPPVALIELKYPREPTEKNAAWTMIYGEVLKDFYRLATYPHEADRVFVYVETDRLAKYMAAAAVNHHLDIGADSVTLHPDYAMAAPATVTGVLGPDLINHEVHAARIASISVDPTLNLHLYAVEPIVNPSADLASPSSAPAARTASPEAPSVRPAMKPAAHATGVRAEILDAVDAILTRSGASTFDLNDVLREMKRRNTRYAESTIRTMVTSHMCSNAPTHTTSPHNDFERVGHGKYRRLV